MNDTQEQQVRPLARQLARELTPGEVDVIAGATANATGTYPPPGHEHDPNWRDWRK